jgi:hypothetical protein
LESPAASLVNCRRNILQPTKPSQATAPAFFKPGPLSFDRVISARFFGAIVLAVHTSQLFFSVQIENFQAASHTSKTTSAILKC